MSPTFGEHFTSELPRTPLGRSSQHSTSRHSGEALSTVPHPQKPRHIGQTVNARGFSYSTCCTLQPLVARQCRGRDIGIESTADVLLTKPSIRTSCASHFLRDLQVQKRADERTRTADLLITSALFNRRRYASTPTPFYAFENITLRELSSVSEARNLS
jgi:hypothetical protein